MAALKKLIPSSPARLAPEGEGTAASGNAAIVVICRMSSSAGIPRRCGLMGLGTVFARYSHAQVDPGSAALGSQIELGWRACRSTACKILSWALTRSLAD